MVLSRRGFLSSAGAVSAALLCRPLPAAPAERSNIIVILADDLGWADLSCYGSKYHETPNLDRLAQQGMRLTSGYATCPVCSPTRASLLTGKYPARLRLTDFLVGTRWPKESPLTPVEWQKRLPRDEVTLAELLRDAGYATGHIGKWHLGDGEAPREHGFNENVGGGRWGTPPSYFSPYKNPTINDGPDGEYLTDRLAAEAESFIQRHRERPFFLQLWHYTVHIPLRARQELVEKYKTKAPDGGQGNPVYAAMIQSLDESVGRVMKKLEELRLAQRTLIVFTSDNGGLSVREGGPIPTSNAPLRAGKGYLYEGGIRVPWIFRWPGIIPAAATSDAPINSADLFPTLLGAAGLAQSAPAGIDGQDILPVLKQSGMPARDALHWHYPHYSNQGGRPGGAVRAGDWKLIEWYEDNSLELYNLRDDLSESVNLAARMPAKAAELHAMLKAWRQSVSAQMPQRRA